RRYACARSLLQRGSYTRRPNRAESDAPLVYDCAGRVIDSRVLAPMSERTHVGAILGHPSFGPNSSPDRLYARERAVRVARPIRPPLSGLISKRRWVTASVTTDHSSCSKLVPGGLKLNSCRASCR